MENEKWVVVYTQYGRLSGDILRLLFESRGIPVFLAQEGAGAAYGLTVGSLGAVSLFIPESRVEEAHQLLQDLENGLLEIPDIDNLDNKDSSEDATITKS